MRSARARRRRGPAAGEARRGGGARAPTAAGCSIEPGHKARTDSGARQSCVRTTWAVLRLLSGRVGGARWGVSSVCVLEWPRGPWLGDPVSWHGPWLQDCAFIMVIVPSLSASSKRLLGEGVLPMKLAAGSGKAARARGVSLAYS